MYTVIYLYIRLQASCTYLFACWVIAQAFYSPADFIFKIKVLQRNYTGALSECQTVWIQIMADILLVLIGFKLFGKAIGRRNNIPLACKEL